MKRKKLVLMLAVLAFAIALAMPNVVSLFAGNSAETMPTESMSSPLVDGSSWTTTEVVSTESEKSSMHPSLDVGFDGTVHIAWEDHTNYTGCDTDKDVFYKRYVPGTGWTTTEVVSTESTDNSFYPSLGIGYDGTIHIAWWDYTDYGGAGTDRDVFYKRYVLGTGWTTTEVVSTESTDDSCYPSLGVGADGTIHIAWQDYTNYTGCDTDRDVFYKRYVPGTGWTTTEVVSTESTDPSDEPSLGVGPDGTIHIAWHDWTDYGDSDTDVDIFYKRYVPPPPPVEPTRLSDLVEFPGLTHLRDLYGTEKTDKYAEIQATVEGYTQIRKLLESMGYSFLTDYNISIVEGGINRTCFGGALYSHWSEKKNHPATQPAPPPSGTRALLVAAMMDDGVDIMLGVVTNLLPPELHTRSMSYMYVEFYLWDKANDRNTSWSYWWYDSDSHPNWFWAVYHWWRTYTRQYYSWDYYQPWWYIWHWLYWKHWNWWSTRFPY